MIINPYRFGQPLLLDIYPNAAVAYSVRKLRTAYSGSALRVRRSSDNTESDIGFVSNQLDTASLLSFVGAGNGFVTTWYDQSGNNRNATQATSTQQPRIVNAGTLDTQNTKPNIYFDGINDRLINSTSISYTNFTLFSTNRFYRVQTSGEILFQYSKLDIAQGGVGLQSSDAGISAIASYSFNDVGTTLLRLHNHLSTVSGATTISTLFLNNIQKATGSKNLTSNKTTIAIGGQDTGTLYYAQLGVSEIILYPSDQSSNLSAINTNINSYFNIYP